MSDPHAAQHAKKELPAFCNYLLNLEFPEHCLGDTRWGVNGYLHPELHEAAESSGRTSTFEEILNMYLESVFGADRSIEEISCTGAEWYARLIGDEQTRELLRSSNARYIATQLGMLHKRGGYPIDFTRQYKGRFWRIKRKEWEHYIQSPSSEVVDEMMPF